jgi:hypothetical protein
MTDRPTPTKEELRESVERLRYCTHLDREVDHDLRQVCDALLAYLTAEKAGTDGEELEDAKAIPWICPCTTGPTCKATCSCADPVQSGGCDWAWRDPEHHRYPNRGQVEVSVDEARARILQDVRDYLDREPPAPVVDVEGLVGRIERHLDWVVRSDVRTQATQPVTILRDCRAAIAAARSVGKMP